MCTRTRDVRVATSMCWGGRQLSWTALSLLCALPVLPVSRRLSWVALPARIPCHEARGRWHCALDPWRFHFALDPRGSRHGRGLHSVARVSPAAGLNSCTQESPAAGLNCERLAPERFRDVNDFYNANGYKATCRPTDILWVLREPSNDALVAAVRMTPQRYKPIGAMLFLRSLCVARDWRRRGLGTVLTRAATAEEDHGLPRYCFALEELVPLYLRAGWRLTPFAAMPLTVLSRFEAVVQQSARKHKKVALLSHGLPDRLFAEDAGSSALAENAQGSSQVEQPPTLQTGARVRIVLLQHANEVPRPTSTGAVLEHQSLRPHLNLERWVWRGRSDNAIITDLLASQLDACVLVWAEAPGTAAGGSETAITAINATYIILDGTWQEARAIFRKCPCLHSLPRVALPAASTAFVLRGNFGWRRKFGCGSVGGSGSDSGGGGGDGGGGGGGGGAEGGAKAGESNGLLEREGAAVLYLHMHMCICIDVCVCLYVRASLILCLCPLTAAPLSSSLLPLAYAQTSLSGLVCTAEAAALLLERAGDAAGCEKVVCVLVCMYV
jgi:DTW domain-containing protein YfiP/GNAT superfamily N-acetyltransferase